MLIATIITYNDWPLIEDCINSIYNRVDKIIIIDGKFKDFPGESNFSTDRTLGYLDYIFRMEQDKLIIIKAPNFDEVGKRNLYFKFLNDGDICLNIDADEVLMGGIPKLTADIGIIQIGEKGDRLRHRRSNRFFRFRKGLHYWGTHKMLLDGEGRLFADLQRVGADYTSQKTNVEFLHNNHKRDYNRKQDKKTYYQILMKREAKVNEPVTN